MPSRLLAGAFAGLLAAAASAAPPDALPALDRISVNAAPSPVPDFTLTEQDGRALRFSSLRGEPALVFFGFTHCPDVCPTTLGRLKSLHAALDGALKHARVVLISV